MKPILLLFLAGMGLALVFGKSKQEFVVVVLGNPKLKHATARAEAAIWLTKHYNVSRIITTGAPKIQGKSEAIWLADYIQQAGVKTPISTDSLAHNTADNVKNVAAMLKSKTRIIVVSDNDHVQSASWCLTHKHNMLAHWMLWPDSTVHPIIPAYANLCKRAGCCK